MSHLLVAVPPALALGWLVRDINRDALESESQQLHASVASRLKETFNAEIARSVSVLNEAERILDMDEFPLERRQVLLRALVATGRIPYLVFYKPDGGFETVIGAPEGETLDKTPVGDAQRKQLENATWTAGNAQFEGRKHKAPVYVPWERDGEVFGYLGTSVYLKPLSEKAKELSTRYLGDAGELDVIDAERRYLISADSSRVGNSAGKHTPFTFEGKDAREDIAALDMASWARFDDDAGARRLGVVVPDSDLRWLVGVSRPESVAFASVFEVQKRVILTSIIAGLLAGLLGLLLARTVSEPIRRLIRAVRGSVRSGFNEGVIAKGGGEVAQLSTAFNEAIRELQTHRAEIRSRTQLRLRLARFLPPTILHEILSKEMDVRSSGERMMTTVVYADVAAPETLGEQIPAEHLVTILGEFFAAACASVERHGGRVDRYSGDAVIGIFTLKDRQDHAQAAVRAAMDILEDTKAISARWAESNDIEFSSAVGTVTGEATLGEAPDGSGEISVVGALVETAAALQADAEPGSVAIDKATHEAADRNLPFQQVRRRTTAQGTAEIFQLNVDVTQGETQA